MKKKNPNEMVPRKTLDKERRQIHDQAANFAYLIMFTIMMDKHRWKRKRLTRLYEQINYLSDSIARGYVKIEDLAKTMDEEAGINFVKGGRE